MDLIKAKDIFKIQIHQLLRFLEQSYADHLPDNYNQLANLITDAVEVKPEFVIDLMVKKFEPHIQDMKDKKPETLKLFNDIALFKGIDFYGGYQAVENEETRDQLWCLLQTIYFLGFAAKHQGGVSDIFSDMMGGLGLDPCTINMKSQELDKLHESLSQYMPMVTDLIKSVAGDKVKEMQSSGNAGDMLTSVLPEMLGSLLGGEGGGGLESLLGMGDTEGSETDDEEDVFSQFY